MRRPNGRGIDADHEAAPQIHVAVVAGAGLGESRARSRKVRKRGTPAATAASNSRPCRSKNHRLQSVQDRDDALCARQRPYARAAASLKSTGSGVSRHEREPHPASRQPHCRAATHAPRRRAGQEPTARVRRGRRSRRPARSSAPRLRSQRDLAFVAAVPIVKAVRFDTDHHHARRIDALLEPAVEIFCPMRLKLSLVADQLGPALDGDEERRAAEQAGRAGEGSARPGHRLRCPTRCAAPS